MIIALWIATAVLALAFAMAGSMKVAKPYAQIAGQDRMEWTEEVTPAQLKTIGALEVVGAVGMILPAATGIAPWLTPVAAFALAVMMGVAFALHVRRRENGTRAWCSRRSRCSSASDGWCCHDGHGLNEESPRSSGGFRWCAILGSNYYRDTPWSAGQRHKPRVYAEVSVRDTVTKGRDSP